MHIDIMPDINRRLTEYVDNPVVHFSQHLKPVNNIKLSYELEDDILLQDIA